MPLFSWDTGKRILDRLGVLEAADPVFDSRITALEDTYVRALWFEEISAGTSGTITPPSGGTIVLDQWAAGIDAVTSTIGGSGQRPSFESVKTSGGVIITATLAANGAWTISGTPSAYPFALLYVYEVKLGDLDRTKMLVELETDQALKVGDSPSFVALTATGAIADNTATTQVATTAFAKAEDAVLKREPEQGIKTLFSAAAGGMTVADDYNHLDVGIDNFTLVWKVGLPLWLPEANKVLLMKGAGPGYFMYVESTTGKLILYLQGSGGAIGSPATSVAPGFVNNTVHELAAVITRETASVNGSVVFYKDGFLFETVVIAAGSGGAINTAFAFEILGYNFVARYEATISKVVVYNRALIASEIRDEYRKGVAWADKGGSQVSLVVSSFVNGVGSLAYDTFDTASTTGFHAVKSSGDASYASSVDEISLIAGKKYKLSFDFTLTSGTAPGRLLSLTQGGAIIADIAYEICAAGLNSIEFTAVTTDTVAIQFYNDDGDRNEFTVANLSLKQIGAILDLEPEGIQPSPGQWLDSSGNKLHAKQPAAGSSLTRRKTDFEIRWTNTWAGTHEAQYIGGLNQPILPPNCYIESIIGVIAGTTIEDIIIGDGSDTDRWVAITTGLAAGTVAFTLVNRISDGTNFKLVVDPDANFTGSIVWVIKGIILG